MSSGLVQVFVELGNLHGILSLPKKKKKKKKKKKERKKKNKEFVKSQDY